MEVLQVLIVNFIFEKLNKGWNFNPYFPVRTKPLLLY